MEMDHCILDPVQQFNFLVGMIDDAREEGCCCRANMSNRRWVGWLDDVIVYSYLFG